MNKSNQLVIFALDDQRYALHLSAVVRVVRVVEITPLPKAPEIVTGMVNVQGQIIPVFNIRKRFRLPERAINLSDQLIIANTSKQPVALIADAVSGVFELSEKEVITSEKILSRMEYVEGVVKLEDGMILIHDIDGFLSVEEEKTLDKALEKI
jgi:purine-binding chemotaxis protein CheW